MRVEILGQERRRRWGDEKKLDVVMSVGLDGATVTEVAHRHDVTRQQIYAWRHELKKKGLLPPTADTVFLPIDTSAMDDAALGREEVAREPALIELRLNYGRSLRFDSGVDATVLTRLIRAVEAA
ncbi:transposase [Rhizobium sp. Pop5]|uniref:IS66-like element accessory protein TnpA n=1 Tax=Rhizobium sp. Pop5 TaxID=1223565 RepID=UPI00028386D7|nr:transposase [Rhizobium sp. Pop5]EJZ17428.1 transposase IS3/IS911 family protein [Rhizobium sp. Pop5]UVD58992.1 transposase [Rhizobium sp. Pop5]